MIKLTVEDYCQNCPEFEADVDKDPRYYYSDVLLDTISSCDTVIRCSHRDECAQLKSYIERNTKKNDIT